MTGLWFLLPSDWQNALFSVQGTFVFAVVLASWMYADVHTTNVLGVDAQQSRAALNDPIALGRLLTARHLLLWLLITPICLFVALGIGVYQDQLARLAMTMIAIAFPPFGALAVAAWLGIRFPYHPIPLAERRRLRGSWWHMWGRWLILVLMPYALVPWLGLLTLVPAYALWATGKGINTPPDNIHLIAGGLLTLTLSLTMWTFGRRMSLRLAHRRTDSLNSYLADPSHG